MRKSIKYNCKYCNKEFNNRYKLMGHTTGVHVKPWLGKKLSDEHRDKISRANKGKDFSEEHRRKISIANKGNKYALGMKHSEDFKIKISNILKLKWGNKKYRQDKIKKLKNNKYASGMKHLEKTKDKISATLKQLWQNPELKKKQSILSKSYWQNPGYAKNWFIKNNIQPNKKELLLNSILSNLYPNDWQYVGDGQVILGGFCPDFINVNGKKQIIEMNGDYWHNREGAAEKDKRKIEAYKQLGYKTLTVWEHELKDTKRLENEIQEFCNA